MFRWIVVVFCVLVAVRMGWAQNSGHSLDAMVARHAAANGVPASLVRRVIHRESRGNPRAVSRGNYGLMQIRLGTARAMGYRGSAAGLLNPETNMTYAVKYLAGAYHAAGGNEARAQSYYQTGYYRRGTAVASSRHAAPSYAQSSFGSWQMASFAPTGAKSPRARCGTDDADDVQLAGGATCSSDAAPQCSLRGARDTVSIQLAGGADDDTASPSQHAICDRNDAQSV